MLRLGSRATLHSVLGLVFALSIIVGSGGLCEGDQPAVSVSLSASKKEVKPCDPVELMVTIRNSTDHEVSVLRPDVIHYSVLPRFQNSVTGESVEPQVLWSSWWVTDHVTIPPGKAYDYAFQLEELFPDCMSPGSYEIWCEYTPTRGGRLETNRIALKVQPLSGDETKEWRAALELIRRGESLDGVCGSADFLRQHPTSRFRNMVRLSLGKNLLKMRFYWDAEKTLRAVLEDPECGPYYRNQANWNMALSLKARGDVEEAIKFVEKIGTPDALAEAAAWSAELPPQPAG